MFSLTFPEGVLITTALLLPIRLLAIGVMLLVCSALICLIELGRIPAWMVIIIIAREFIISGFRLIASDEGVVIAASYWGKIKTVVQIIMIIAVIIEFPYAMVIAWAAVILTIVSLVDYVIKNIHVIKKGGM